MDQYQYPKLIENQTKNFLLENLRSCHDYRQKRYIFTWNLMIFIIFVTIFVFTLYVCSQRKKMNETKSPQNDQEYILNKIKEMREMEKYQTQMKSMTQLPVTVPISSEYDQKRIPEHSSGYAY
jgi:F0F1-type ATP synthase membrane subunit a